MTRDRIVREKSYILELLRRAKMSCSRTDYVRYIVDIGRPASGLVSLILYTLSTTNAIQYVSTGLHTLHSH